MHRVYSGFLGLIFSLMFVSCMNDEFDPSLTIPNAPAAIKVNDSMATAPASLIRNDQGYIVRNSVFRNYHLVSDDSSVVQARGYWIVGKSPGTTHITAIADDGSNLASDRYAITVTP